jgi:hypothetical protein
MKNVDNDIIYEQLLSDNEFDWKFLKEKNTPKPLKIKIKRIPTEEELKELQLEKERDIKETLIKSSEESCAMNKMIDEIIELMNEEEPEVIMSEKFKIIQNKVDAFYNATK